MQFGNLFNALIDISTAIRIPSLKEHSQISALAGIITFLRGLMRICAVETIARHGRPWISASRGGRYDF